MPPAPGGPVREDLQSGLTGMAAQIYGDIDFHFAQAARDLVAVEAREVVKAVEALDQRARMALSSPGPVEIPITSKRLRSWRSIRGASWNATACSRKSAET